MKRYSQRHGGGLVSELNVTPLIDLAFTLLIIFMITAPLMEYSMEIDLPKSSQTNTPIPGTVKEVSVDRNGRIFFEKKAVSAKEFELALHDMMRRDPSAAVSLRADSQLRYQELVTVLDSIRRSGAKLGLATLPGN
ncbi:MAG: ExbD/TolR family protein [Candidatus Methylacidiphilales bacterium]